MSTLNLFPDEKPIEKKPVLKHKDWKGSESAVFKTLAASAHSDEERKAFDYYATDPFAGELLMQLEKFNNKIWEPCCGEGHLSKIFIEHGYNVKSTDIIYRGYGENERLDFLGVNNLDWDGDIITNPPYSYAKECVLKALDIIPEGKKVAMFLKLTFLEGKGRAEFFRENPPVRVWVSSSRINCAKNGDFTKMRGDGGSAVCYAWYIWEKGFKGETTLKWFN